MDHPKIAAALALLLIPLVAGCASLRWSIQKSLRTEGAHIDAFPEKVAREYECAARKLPFVSHVKQPIFEAGGTQVCHQDLHDADLSLALHGLPPCCLPTAAQVASPQDSRS